MRKKFAAALGAIAAALAIAALILSFSPSPNGLLVEGIFIDSSKADPFQAFASLSEGKVFLISPQMNERSKAVDHLMFNSTALFLQVLEGNKRNTIQVIRVQNESGELSHCLTNYGDVNRSETLQKEACLQYLSSENGAIVLIQFPDEKLQYPSLEVSENKLVVKPKTSSDIGTTCFLALRIMFKNSQSMIEKSNVLFGRLVA